MRRHRDRSSGTQHLGTDSSRVGAFKFSTNHPRHAWLVHANESFSATDLRQHSAKNGVLIARLLAFDVATLRTDSSSVEARGLYKKREWIEREVIREAARPAIGNGTYCADPACDFSALKQGA